MKPEIIRLEYQAPKDTWDKFLGVKLDEKSYDRLIETDCDVYTPEGEILLKFRRKCIPVKPAAVAYEILKKIKQKSFNRGMATGKMYAKTGRVTKKGTISKTHAVAPEDGVMSAIVGYFDRYVRIPFCRQTAFTADFPEKFQELLPYFQAVDRIYAAEAPERYALQRAVVDRTSKDFVIRGTAFTTVTVNQNFQTAVHTDKGDLKDGLSCITCLEAGEYRGANLVFPHYRVAVNLRTCDLLMFNSHHMHGNTPIIGKVGQWKRISCVLYYRENMHQCGTAADELERAKKRQRGEPLY